MRFDPKISTREERADLSTLSMDELHGILTAYEMRTKQYNPSRKEATFKASKKTRKNKKKSKSNCSYNDDSYEDEEITNFIRKSRRDTGKYKGKLPLKCFNCGKIGHFPAKCGNIVGNKINIKNKCLYSREDNSSSKEDDDSDSESERVLFMALENQEVDKEEYEE
jgi:hypothetical protein